MSFLRIFNCLWIKGQPEPRIGIAGNQTIEGLGNPHLLATNDSPLTLCCKIGKDVYNLPRRADCGTTKGSLDRKARPNTDTHILDVIVSLFPLKRNVVR
jgi:hypothetical protein